MSNVINIAIDGPGGAGKSTVAKLLAKKLGFIYIDTGAMYRAVALKGIRSGVRPQDLAAVEQMLSDTDVSIKFDGGEQRVFLDGTDVSTDIRQHDISEAASVFSAIPAVRHKLVALQRQIALGQSCVLDGRDIGSYVLPKAKHKFFLTADLAVRAERRYQELLARGQAANLKEVMQDLKLRDERDSQREFAPLKQAADAVLIDATSITARQAADLMYSYINPTN